MSGSEEGAAEGGVEELERVVLRVHDCAAGNGDISGTWWTFRSCDIGGKERVIDLVLDRSFVGGALAGGGRVGPEVTLGLHDDQFCEAGSCCCVLLGIKSLDYR